MNKFISSMLAISIFLPVIAQATDPATLTDLNEYTEYKTAIDYMANNGVVEGYPDHSFRPDSCVNRAEFIKMLMWTLQVDVTKYHTTLFSDTDANLWYGTYLQAAKSLGIISGYPDGTFKPAQCVNRAEAVKMAARQFFPSTDWNDQTLVQNSESNYEDVSKTGWYSAYMHFLFNKNLIGLRHVINKSFKPGDSMSRKEVAEMLYRMKASVDNNNSDYAQGTLPQNIAHTIGKDKTPTKPACYKEGESLGALYPTNFDHECCEGLYPYIEPGMLGTMGICKPLLQ